MGLKMKNFDTIWFLGQDPIPEKPFYRGDCLKRGLGQFADLRGGLAEKRGWGFWGGVDTPVYTMIN